MDDMDDEYADEFNRDEPSPPPTDAARADRRTGDAGQAAQTPVSPGMDQGGTAQAPAEATRTAPADPALDARLRDLLQREQRLSALQADLAAREAALKAHPPAPQASDSAHAVDPAAALAADFGQDFVAQITALVKQVCGESIGKSVGDVSARVDDLIAHLQDERRAHHFKAIAAVHADFADVVASPAFQAWRAGLARSEQAEIARIIDDGSADDIIKMLSQFKSAHAPQSGKPPKPAGADPRALDAAEGVRSHGVRLPKPPTPVDDFAAAWHAA